MQVLIKVVLSRVWTAIRPDFAACAERASGIDTAFQKEPMQGRPSQLVLTLLKTNLKQSRSVGLILFYPRSLFCR